MTGMCSEEKRKRLRMTQLFLALEVEWMWMLLTGAEHKGHGAGLVKLGWQVEGKWTLFWACCFKLLLDVDAFGKTNVVVRREVGARDGDSGDLRILVVLKTLELSKCPQVDLQGGRKWRPKIRSEHTLWVLLRPRVPHWCHLGFLEWDVNK